MLFNCNNRIVFPLILVFLLSVFGVKAQNIVQGKPIRLRLNWESVDNMRNGADMGLMGAGGEFFNVFKKAPNFYTGFQSYAAITGQNGGFFAFGITTGYRLPLITNSLHLDLGGFLGGGGDGKRAEDGGLILGSRLELEKRFGSFGLRAGVSHLQFVPSHQSTHITLGLSVNPSLLFIPKSIDVSDINNSNSPVFDRLRISLLGRMLLLNDLKQVKGPDKDLRSSLMGLQLNYFINPYVYANMELNGAITGGIYGYMSYLFGVGAISPRLANVVALEGSISGGANGGSPFTVVGGGAIIQPEAGLNFRLTDKHYLKTMAGRTWTPDGNINHNHFTFALGTDLRPSRLKGNYTEVQNLMIKDSVKIHALGFYTFNRTYFTNSSGVSTRGNKYDSSFNLIGLGLKKYFIPQFSVSGSTAWTYTGSYGGYGEGWLSAAYHQNILKKSDELQLEVEVGVGASGGILNVGSGFISKYGAGARWNVGSNSSIFIQGGEMRPTGGNFKAHYLDFGAQIYLDAVFGK